MANARKRGLLGVDGALSLLENCDSEDDFDSESDDPDDDIPLAHFARRPDSDNELEDADFVPDDDALDNAPEVVVDNNFLNGLADGNGRAWNSDIRSRDDANVRFTGVPGLSRETIEQLGGQDSLNSATPLSLFKLYFTDAVVQIIIDQTNLYARQERTKNPAKHKAAWTELTVIELYAWLGLLISMGVVKKTNMKDYWTTDWLSGTPGFGKVMSRDRFLVILRYIHFQDNTTAVTDRTDPAYDKLYKVRPVLDAIVSTLRNVYAPDREIAIDESMIACKSRFGFKQFMRDKPIRWGLKVFMLSESVSGYVLNMQIYVGKENNATEKGATHDVVMQVSSPYLNLGHAVYMDNFYTSVPLFEDLLSKRTLACGTVRSNRKGLPNDTMSKTSPAVKGMKRGDSLYRFKGSVTAVSWKDNKLVTLLTTIPVGEETENVSRSSKQNGQFEKIDVPRPMAIGLYNAYMGGVDLSDQRINGHKRLMRGLVWYLKIFWFLLDICRINSYLLYQDLKGSKIKMKDYTLQLAEELIGNFTSNSRNAVVVPELVRRNRNLDHAPELLKTRSACTVHLQRVDTPYVCSVCKVRLCPAPCFYRFHYMKDYQFRDPQRPEAPSQRKKKK